MPMALLPWTGSSPHTRGARRHRARGLRPHGIIPAYAGSTRAAHVFWLWRKDHPRIRGEHACPVRASAVSVGSSPHTRGAQENRSVKRKEGRIIPA